MTTHDDACLVVVVCGCNSLPLVDDCLRSLREADDPGLPVRVVFVDDGGSDGSSEHVRRNYPDITVVKLARNVGFAGANNAGWREARHRWPGMRYLFLLNVDTILDRRALAELTAKMAQRPTIGAAQAKLRLHPRTDQLNSAGNRCHYLGYGWVTALNEVDHGQYDHVDAIDYASGAAVMIRASLLDDVGLFDEAMFMYHEDTELSWKLRLAGHEIVLAAKAVVYHKYTGSAPVKYYYHLERNRWVLLLTHYRWRTLLLLSPAMLLMEIGQVLFALRQGKLWDKLRVWGWLVHPANLAYLHRRRKESRRIRRISDRPFMADFACRIEHPGVDGPILRHLGNPALAAWWRLARPMIR
ncbi:MAG: glycosyltransferase family 2 protein [Phycisphaeraceae bacterium]|nr:glycosyltransferase family 2 protein [Phycisphaeraceae bacterium]